MKTNPLKQDLITKETAGIVICETIRVTVIEKSLPEGHPTHDLWQSNGAETKLEQTDNPDLDPKDALLESAPESERWDPVPGSIGHKMRENPGDDEDDEGRSNSERLVEHGVHEAAEDQMLQAAKATREDK